MTTNTREGSVVPLQEQLLRREFHLAELIDEVVFAENERKESLHIAQSTTERLKQVEGLLRYLLQFQLTLVGEIIIPALVESEEGGAIVSHPGVRQALHDMESDRLLSEETRTLIRRVLDLSLKRSKRGSSSEASVSRAVRLSSFLLRNQASLLENLDRLTQRQPSPVLPTGEVRSPSRALFDYQEQLFTVERERDALREHLAEITKAETVVESLMAEKKQMEKELVTAQQQTLDLQDENRRLNQRVLSLEDEVHTLKVKYRTISTPKELTRPDPNTLSLVQSLRNELQQISHEAQVSKGKLEHEVHRLDAENAALRRGILPPSSLGSVSEGKLGQLENVVAALRSDLSIMESRVAAIREQRETERRRILHASASEREKWNRDREECRLLLNKMATELKALEEENESIRGFSSMNRL